MTSYTISGITSLPDDTDPLAGTWFVRVYASPPAAVDADGSVRAGVWSGSTDETGALSQAFPETTGDGLYEAWFQSADRKANLGRYQFALTADTTWGAIMTAPSPLPPNPVPADVAIANHIANPTGAHAATAISTANGSNVEVQLGLKATASALTTEATTRATADTTLQTNITSEATARANADANLQPLDTDLTTISTLDSTQSGVIASDGSGWFRKTYAQLKTALGLTKADVGLSAVDNTSDLAKPISNATATALSAKADLVGGTVPANQLPSFVDDVLEFANLAAFPATGEAGKIYVALDTNLTYRWGGSAYGVLDPSLALGETAQTAYRGDRGKTAYDHSQITSGNPHGTSKSDVGLGSVTNDAQVKASDVDTDSTMAANSDAKVASQKATKTALAGKVSAGSLGLNVKDYGALGDGSTNDRTAIQAAIDAGAALVVAGLARCCNVFLPPGRYVLGSTLTPKSGVRVNGFGALVTGTFAGAAFTASSVDCLWFEISEITFEGTVNSFPTAPTRARTTSGTGLNSAVDFNGNLNTGVGGGGTATLTNFTMRNCVVNNMSGLPAVLRGVGGTVRVVNNTFYNCFDVGFTYCNEAIFSGNHVEMSCDNGVSLSRGNKKIVCVGNTFENCCYAGIFVAGFSTDKGPQDFTITGNVIKDVGQAGIRMDAAPKYGTVIGNEIDCNYRRGPTDEPTDGSCVGIMVAGYPTTDRTTPTDWAQGINISGNTIRRAARAGVLVVGGKQIDITNNTLIDIGTQFLADGTTVILAADLGQNVGILFDQTTTNSDCRVALNRVTDTRTTPYTNWAIYPVGSGVVDEYLNTMTGCRNASNLVETGPARNRAYAVISSSADKFTAGATAGTSTATGTVAGFDLNGASSANRMHSFLSGSNIQWRQGADGSGNYQIRRHTGTSGGAFVDTPVSVDATLGQVQALTYPLRVFAAATGSRPSAVTAGAGAHMFDTTLGKPIWSNGAAWKDATGTTV